MCYGPSASLVCFCGALRGGVEFILYRAGDHMCETVGLS